MVCPGNISTIWRLGSLDRSPGDVLKIHSEQNRQNPLTFIDNELLLFDIDLLY